MTASTVLWFDGVCDTVLAKIIAWDQNYARGEIESTRSLFDSVRGIVEQPTRYAHRIAWRQVELDHLVRILQTVRPGPLAEELDRVRGIWKNGHLLPGGARVLTMIFYPEHVRDIAQALLEAKSGQKAMTAESLIEGQQAQGKELFEI